MLDGFIVGHWRYGFVGLMFVYGFVSKQVGKNPPANLSGQLYFVPAFLAVIHFSVLWPALHRQDSTAELLFFQTGMYLVVFLGTWVAYELIKVLFSPMLIPIGHPHFIVATVATVLMIFGVTLVADFYAGEIIRSVSLSVGIIALLLGGVILGTMIYLYLFRGSRVTRERMWATLLLILLLGIQALYDFLLAEPAIVPFHGAILLAAMVVSYVIAYLVVRYILGSGPFEKNHRRNLYFWASVGTIDFLTTLVAYLVDINTGTDFWAVFYSQIAATVFWVLVLWWLQWTRFHKRLYRSLMRGGH